MNPFPTVQLPGVAAEERAVLAKIHETGEAHAELKFRFLTALVGKARGTLYAGTVPAHVKATRRRRNKAARIARRAAR